MVKIKICGITNLEDARLAAEMGADALGFNFYRKSPRYIDPAAAKSIIEKLPPLVATIGIFVNEFNPDRVISVANAVRLSAVQLHGSEAPGYVRKIQELRIIKAFRIQEPFPLHQLAEYSVHAYLLDAYVPGQQGGTGTTFNWEIAAAAKRYGRIILAGGLNPGNIRKATLTVQPYALDICSGIENSPGRKDPVRMQELFQEIFKARLELYAQRP
jgi:phosphoribosylanthranilate isomerase